MDERLLRMGAAMVAALAMTWTGGTATAQLRSFNPDTMECGDQITLACDVSGVSCNDGTGSCVRFDAERALCVPNAPVLCCSESSDCPSGRCIATLPDAGTTVGDGFCVPPANDYCAEVPSREQLLRCHTRPDGRLAYFVDGDCDGDGVPNAVELLNGTFHCTAPNDRALWNGAECVPLPLGCHPGDSCSIGDDADTVGVCVITPGNEVTRCEPVGGALFCGAPFECASDEVSAAETAGDQPFCVRDVCPADAEIDLIDCIIHPETGEYVSFAKGDCDDDGIANELERDEASLCGVAPEDDAGTPEGDAGTPQGDAGAPEADAGTSERDAGPPVPEADAGPGNDPGFEGGGGCACRAGAARAGSSGSPAFFAIAFVVAGLLRRRRR